MRNYMVQLAGPTLESRGPRYTLAIGRRMKEYFLKEDFVSDLKERIGCSERFIEGFFANPKTNNVIMDCPLTDENAAYFGQHH
jgi:hypothetical protein